MDAMDAVKAAAKQSCTPITHIGVSMGKRPNYINVAISRGRTPQADTLAAMLAPCGYVLAAMPKEDVPATAIVVD